MKKKKKKRKKERKGTTNSLLSINRNISFDDIPHGRSLEILVQINLELCPWYIIGITCALGIKVCLTLIFLPSKELALFVDHLNLFIHTRLTYALYMFFSLNFLWIIKNLLEKLQILKLSKKKIQFCQSFVTS